MLTPECDAAFSAYDQFNWWTAPDPVLSAYGRQVEGCSGPEARALLGALVAAHGGEPLDEWRRRLVS